MLLGTAAVEGLAHFSPLQEEVVRELLVVQWAHITKGLTEDGFSVSVVVEPIKRPPTAILQQTMRRAHFAPLVRMPKLPRHPHCTTSPLPKELKLPPLPIPILYAALMLVGGKYLHPTSGAYPHILLE